MQNFVFKNYRTRKATYRFINRGGHKFSQHFIEKFMKEIDALCHISLSEKEFEYLKSLNLFTEDYLLYLKEYRFNKSELTLNFVDNDLSIFIEGDWVSTILWEVPLMSLICEISYLETNNPYLSEAEKKVVSSKIDTLINSECNFIEFGTRRRKSFAIQSEILDIILSKENHKPFIGTSNVLLAMDKGVRCLGTYAHELVMAMQVLHSVEESNYFCMKEWASLFPTLKIALSDTLTTNYFLRHFDKDDMDEAYDGVRQDSGDPFVEGAKIVKYYRDNGIDPLAKKILFSDSLNPDKCVLLNREFGDKIKVSFGIGTDITSGFNEVRSLNIVIKLNSIDNIPVIKLSDDIGKTCGNSDYVADIRRRLSI